MEKKQVSKRLYVGGLGHTVSKAELQERFGKFGRVLDAEIITRKDNQGNGFTLSFKNKQFFSMYVKWNFCFRDTVFSGNSLVFSFQESMGLYRN